MKKSTNKLIAVLSITSLSGLIAGSIIHQSQAQVENKTNLFESQARLRLGDQPITLKKESFSLQELSIDPALPLDDSQVDDNYFKKIIVDKQTILFDNLPNDQYITNDLITALTIDSKNVFTGQAQITFAIENGNNQTLTITGFTSKETSLQNTSFDFGDSSKLPNDQSIDDNWIITKLQENKDTIFTNLPTNYEFNNSNIVIENKNSDLATGTLTFDATFKNVYTTDGSLKNSLTFNGFKTEVQQTITTTVNNGDLTGVEQILPSDWNANEETIKQAIIESKTIITGLLDQTTIEKTDLTLQVESFDNLQGQISVAITISNSKVCENNQPVETKTFSAVTLGGFKTQQPTAANSQKQFNDISFEQVLADAYTNEQITQFINDHKNEIYLNLPETAALSISGDPVKNNEQRKITLTVTVDKYFDSKGIEQTQNIPSELTFEITLEGFKEVTTKPSITLQKQEVTLDELSIQPVTLDDQSINEDYFKNILVTKQGLIFSNLPNEQYVTNENIKSLTIVQKNVATGSVSISFELDSNQYELKINGFTPKVTSLKNTTFAFGDDSILADNSSINNDWIIKKLKENADAVFTNLPNNYEFNTTNIGITNIQSNVADGSITFEATFKNVYVDSQNQISSTITFTGFKTQTQQLTNTSMTGGEIAGFDSQLASTITGTEENFKQALIPLITNPAPNQTITPADLEITTVSSDDLLGKLVVNVVVINNKAVANGNVTERVEFNNISLTGFKKKDAVTTTINPTLQNVNTILPSDYNQYLDQIKQAIIINTTNVNGTLEANDIQLVYKSSSNLDGSLTLEVTIINSKVNVGGVVQETYKFPNDIVFTGFKTQKPTTVINYDGNKKIDLIGYDSTLASLLFDNNNDNIKKMIFDKKAEIFTNLPDNFAQDNITIKTVNVDDALGTITVSFAINNYYDQNGELQSTDVAFDNVVFGGFQKDTATTTLNTTLQGVDQIIPSEWEANKDTIKQAIINNLTNASKPNGEIQLTDIEITFVSADDKQGQLVLDVKLLNNVGKENGAPVSELTLSNQTLTGFKVKKTQPTSIKIEATDQGQGLAIGSSSKAVSQWLADPDVDLQQFIFDHRAEMFNSLPQDLTKDNIIVPDKSSAENIIDNANGTLVINVKLNKYINDSGDLVEGEFGPFKIKITGFKTETSTTTINSSLRNEFVGNILASQVKEPENIAKFKQAILANVEHNFPGTTIELGDIEIVEDSIVTDDYSGTVRATIKINNFKAQENGNVVQSKEFTNISFTGFKRDDSLKTTTFVGGAIVGFENLLPSDVTIENVKDKLIPELIKQIQHPAKDQTIESADIEIIRFINPNNLDGSIEIEFKVINNKAWIDWTPQDVTFRGTLTGFKSQQPTSHTGNEQNPQEIQLDNVSTEIPSAYFVGDKDINKIKQLILDKKDVIFQNAPDLTLDNIIVETNNVKTNNPEGIIIITASINKFFNSDGILVDGTLQMPFSIKFTGFKTDTSTTGLNANDKLEVELSNVNTFLPSQWNVNKDALIAAIIKQVQNVVPGKQLEAADIDFNLIDSNDVLGIISGTITIKNSKAQENGIAVPALTLGTNEKPYIFKGFKIDTELTTTKVVGGVVAGFDQDLASTITADSNDNNNAKLKQAIIDSNMIKNVATGATIEVADLVIQSITSANNATGQLTISIKIINNKAWENGQAKEMTFNNVVLSGFKIQKPTTVTTNWIDCQSVDQSIVNAPHVVPTQVNEATIKKIIFAKKDEIFASLPTSFEESNINIISSTPNNGLGKINVSFEINNYYNENGILETSTPLRCNDFVLSGFKMNTSTTGIKTDPEIKYLKDKYYWQFNKDDQNDINGLKNSIIKDKIFSNTNGDLLVEDIDINIISVTNDSVNVIITINNSKALDNGQPIESKVFGTNENPIILKGFKPIDSSLNTDIQIGGGSLNEELIKVLNGNKNPTEEDLNKPEFRQVIANAINNQNNNIPEEFRIKESDISISNLVKKPDSNVITFTVSVKNCIVNGMPDKNPKTVNLELNLDQSTTPDKPSDDKKEDSISMSSIIGGVIMITGGILLVVMIIIMYLKAKKKNNDGDDDSNDDYKEDENSHPYYDPYTDPYNDKFEGYE